MSLAGFVLGLVGATASCEPDGPDAFNDEAADLVCEIYRKCGEDLTRGIELHHGLPDDDDGLETACFSKVWDDFSACGDHCEFKRPKARRCLRRLERMADSCEAVTLGPCRRVYTDCDASQGTTDSSCKLWNCSVTRGSTRGAYWGLGLLLLGGWARRRRRG